MKYTCMIFATFFIQLCLAQTPNTEDGLAVQGYDLVAYFDLEAIKGDAQFQVLHEGVTYYFSSAENKEVFLKSPDHYLPQYGGWCAYAMATNGELVSINPKIYEIRDEKLYLFYNKFFTNTLESWQKENPQELIVVANKNWAKY